MPTPTSLQLPRRRLWYNCVGGLFRGDFLPDDRPALASLRALIADSALDLPDDLPPMAAGLFGVFGYDMVRLLEPLGAETIRSVVTKFVLQLEAQLADRNITIELTDEATDWLAKNGFDELYGARPLARVIQEHIKKPLADDILFGRLTRGGHVKVTLTDGKIAFDVSGPNAAQTKAVEAQAAD